MTDQKKPLRLVEQPLPIDGAVLLDELRDTITRYVVFADKHAPAAVALWIATTHALPAFECAPRLVISSPQKRCAKSRLLDIIAGTCHKPLATVNATTAAIFRSIGDNHPPTLILDEADTLWGSKKVAEQNEDLRALLNAGHQRGRPALRCVGALADTHGVPDVQHGRSGGHRLHARHHHGQSRQHLHAPPCSW
jgi:hypothetical protein